MLNPTSTLDPSPDHPQTPATRRARRSANLDSLAMEQRAAGFTGLPEGVKHPDQVLDTFKAAAPALGIPKPVVELISHLASRTQPRDWQKGARPLAWPSNQDLMHSLGRRPTAISSAITRAVKLGLVVMKDSPSGKRYGSRDDAGAIIEARTFGFDLSPLALRYQELKAAATAHRAHHKARMDARRHVTREREGLFQIIDTAEELGLWSTYWEQITERAEQTRRQLTPTLGLAETRHVAQCLASWRVDARAMLDRAVQNRTPEDPRTEKESESSLSENRELKNTTDSSSQACSKQNLVTARQEGSSGQGSAQPATAPPVEGAGAGETITLAEVAALETKGITPARIADFCPVLGAYVGPDPSWRDLGNAAQALAANYEISHRTWARAYAELGAQAIIVVFAILASLPRERFAKGPGAYFAGMINAHRHGRLNLIGSFHGMRERAEQGTCPAEPPPRAAKPKLRSDSRQFGNLAIGVLAKAQRKRQTRPPC